MKGVLFQLSAKLKLACMLRIQKHLAIEMQHWWEKNRQLTGRGWGWGALECTKKNGG